MPKFSFESKQRLSTCDRRIQEVLNEAIKYFDFAVIVGHRGKEAQDEAFRTGVSKKPWPTSNHNKTPSKAVDIAPYPIDWKDTERFYYLAGWIMAIAKLKGINMRAGLDWDMDTEVRDQTFFDLGHVELIE